MGDVGCQHVPIDFTPVTDVQTDLRKCKTCSVRLSAQPGPGRLTPSRTGFTVDESPLTTLYYNGLEYTLKETHLVLRGESAGGTHRLPGLPNTPPAELLFYFERPGQTYCLAVPVLEGNGVGNTYFKQLNQVVRKRQSMSAAIDPSTQLFQYSGSDLRGRYGSTSTTAFPAALCSKKVQFLVCSKPAYILAPDLLRFTKALSEDYVGPVQSRALVLADIQSLVRVVPNVTLDGPSAGPSSAKGPDDVYLTRELQCRRLDVAKDVEGDRVYVGGAQRPGDSTLEKELAAAADSQAAFAGEEVTVQPGQIETILAIVFGTLVGFFVLLGAFYLFWRTSGRNYWTKLGKDYPKILDPLKAVFKKAPGS